MKKLIITLIIIIISLGAFAQSKRISRDLNPNLSGSTNTGVNANNQSFGGDNKGNKLGQGKDTPMSTADSARLLIKPRMTLWVWEHEGVYKTLSKRDTTIDNAHNYSPVFLKSISNTYTSNIVSPYISNIFIDRDTRTSNQFLKVYDAFLTRPEDFKQRNTTTPFTELLYKTGGSKVFGENYLKITHCQNITPFLNAGIHYNYLTGGGSYMHSKSTVYDFSFFASYEKDRIVIDLFTNNNLGSFEENGGIADPSFIRDTTINAESIAVKLMYPETNFYNKNLNLKAQYNIGKAKQLTIGKDTSVYYPLKTVYSYQKEDNFRRFSEKTVVEDYYSSNYISDENTLDENEYLKYNQSLKLVWNEEHKSIKPGIYAGLKMIDIQHTYNKEVEAADAIVKSTGLESKEKFNTSYFEGGIFKRDSGKINYDINTSIALSGSYSDEMFINANIDYNINANNSLCFKAKYSNKAPDFNLQYYFSNHYKWKNKFNYEKNIQLKGSYINKKANLEIGIAANRLNNYIQFGLDTLPTQNKESIEILTAYIQHKLKLGKFYFLNKVYLQHSSSDEINLPKIALYASYYYKTYLVNNALLLKIGADLTYNTNFYAPSYIAATNSFYRQNKEKFGNYPKIDLVVDVKIKRMTIFIKYEHLSNHFAKNDYFINSYNALNPATLKYGLRWIFND
jgi:hypothetical protein